MINTQKVLSWFLTLSNVQRCPLCYKPAGSWAPSSYYCYRRNIRSYSSRIDRWSVWGGRLISLESLGFFVINIKERSNGCPGLLCSLIPYLQHMNCWGGRSATEDNWNWKLFSPRPACLQSRCWLQVPLPVLNTQSRAILFQRLEGNIMRNKILL